jgi:hypothetical protein
MKNFWNKLSLGKKIGLVGVTLFVLLIVALVIVTNEEYDPEVFAERKAKIEEAYAQFGAIYSQFPADNITESTLDALSIALETGDDSALAGIDSLPEQVVCDDSVFESQLEEGEEAFYVEPVSYDYLKRFSDSSVNWETDAEERAWINGPSIAKLKQLDEIESMYDSSSGVKNIESIQESGHLAVYEGFLEMPVIEETEDDFDYTYGFYYGKIAITNLETGEIVCQTPLVVQNDNSLSYKEDDSIEKIQERANKDFQEEFGKETEAALEEISSTIKLTKTAW